MRRFFLLIGSVLLGCSPFLLGAQVRPEGEQAPPLHYILAGTVVNGVTNQPLARALVEVSGMGAVLTGPDGHFQIPGSLASGTEMNITIHVSKPGFYEQQTSNYFGSRLSRILGSTAQHVTITPDSADLQRIKLALMPASAIAGAVQDSDGNPVENATVKVVQSDIVEGRSRWQDIDAKTTDEDGHFRIANLRAGRYYVAVLPGSYRRSLDNFSEGFGYPAVVYYPNSPDRASASPVELKPGEKLELPFELSKVPVFKISGTLLGGKNKRYEPLRLSNQDGEDTGRYAGYTSSSASFEFDAVPAGHYLLQAGDRLRTEVPVIVERNITDLTITLQPAISVPVKVQTEFNRSGGPQPIQAASALGSLMSVGLHSVGTRPEDISTNFQATKNGTLELKDLRPGKYSLDFSTSLGYVSSARCGSTDLLREPLTVAAPMPPMEIVLRNDTGSLAVKLVSAGTNPDVVLLVLSNVPGVRPTLMPLIDAKETTLQGLAPGEYSVFAFDRIDQIEYRNPEVLEQYATRAAHVTIMPGNSVEASVEVIHTAE